MNLIAVQLVRVSKKTLDKSPAKNDSLAQTRIVGKGIESTESFLMNS